MAHISVIMPVYNVQAYLRPCLDSVLSQSLRDIEVICVDDGSTDASGGILEEYRARDARVRIISTANQGLSCARNTGLAAAAGKYVYFVDSDDLLVPDALARMFERAEHDALEVLAVGIEPFCDDECLQEQTEAARAYYSIDHAYDGVYSGTDLLCEMVKNRDYRVNAYATMTLRAMLIRTGLIFYPHILHEDNLYTYQLMCSARTAGVMRKDVYLRRFRANSIVTKPASISNFYGVFMGYEEAKRFVLDKRLYEDARSELFVPLLSMQRSAIRFYLELPGAEREKTTQFAPRERFLFHMDFADSAGMRNRFLQSEAALVKVRAQLAQAQKALAEETARLDSAAADIVRLTAENARLKQEIRSLTQERAALQRSAALARQEAERVLHSRTFRLGDALLCAPKKLLYLWRGRKERRLRGQGYDCPCCGATFSRFDDFPYFEHREHYNEAFYHRHAKNTLCPKCRSLPRHRILCAYFDAHRELFAEKSVLAFALERGVRMWLDREGIAYKTADLYAAADVKLDIQNIALADASEDIVLCNHILEHVTDYQRALGELYRILRPGGVLIVSVPVLKKYVRAHEDPAVTTETGRREAFGQVDHLRIFGRGFARDLERAGFAVTPIRGSACDARIRPVVGPASYDINELFLCRKR